MFSPYLLINELADLRLKHSLVKQKRIETQKLLLKTQHRNSDFTHIHNRWTST